MSNVSNRRAAGFGIRRNLRGPEYGSDPAFTPQIEVIADGVSNLVCANGVQVVAGPTLVVPE